jgi:alcohol dehydrogenase class IV
MRDNLERAVERGEEDEEARGNMLVAASLAININLGAVHALSHPVGAHHGVPHGVANAIHLPHVIRFNAAADDVADRFRDLNELLGLETGGSDEEVAQTLAGHVTGLVARLGLPTRLSETGVPEASIPVLVEGAMGDAASLLNPREVGEDDYAGLYRRAL